MSGTIFLEASEFSIGEPNGPALVSIVRTGDLTGTATIVYGITPHTATPDVDYIVDYIGGSGTVTMAVGQDRIVVPVTIINDDAPEQTETFIFSIIDVDSESTLLFPRTALIDILDDENPVVDPPNPPLNSSYVVTQQPVITGLNQPMAFEFAPQDPSLVFIPEKEGRIRVFDLDTESFLPDFVNLTAKVNNTQERGLFDIAFHPNFPEQPFIYAFYVVDPPDTAGLTGNAGPDGSGNRFAHVVRFTADAATGFTTLVPGSEFVLVGAAGQTLQDISGGGAVNSTSSPTQPESGFNAQTGQYVDNYIKLDSTSHAGGSLAFGPDGNLYISIGDGASFNGADPRAVSVQNINSLSGKILRVDPITGLGLPDNPFVQPGDSLTENHSKVYQLGLRNPFSMGFDQDGHLFITNTGWASWEEIESGPPGANFGWPYYEGGDNGVLFKSEYQNLSSAPAFYAAVDNGTIEITPAYRAFSHDSDVPGFENDVITGGDVIYTGARYPVEFQNDFFFTDFDEGEVFVIDVNDSRDLKFLYVAGSVAPVHFSQGPDGYIYYTDLFTGVIGRLLIEPIPTGPVVKAINSGGGAVTVGGISYEADTIAAPNSLAPGSQNNTFSNAIAIAGTGDDVLHQTERWGDPFGYDIPLANGQYQLELDFAEIYFGAPGGAAGGSASRVFDVTVEGLQVISNLDLFAAHGAANATSIFIPVTVSDGVLDIDFAADADNAKLSALVVRSGAPGSGPGPLVFKLIDADNGQVIDQDVSNGVAPLDPSVFAGQLTLVGFAASGQTVSGPVTITLTGNGVNFSKVENTGPYSLFGDSGGTTFGGSSIQPGAYTVGANANGIPQSVAFTLQAIAQTPSLAIAATDASKAEGNTGSTPFTFTVTRSGSTTGASSANYTVAGSGANPAAAADFTGAALATGIVSFAAGEAAPKLITINVAGDITAEANEGFTVTLSAPSAGTTIATAAATGTIVNDDASGPGPGPLVFKLIDADNGQVIDQDVSDGVAPLDPSVFAGQLTLAGFAASGQTVSGPVTITLTGNGVNFSKVENTGPYSLFGDSGGTTFGGSSIQPGAYTVGANANSIPQSAAFTLQAIADVPGPVIKAINAGGGAVTVGGISYEADTTAAPNSLAPGSDNFTFNNAIAIAGTNNDVLHQSERWGDPFGYDIPLANGQYQLELDFAEIYFGAPGGAAGGSGSRVFDVTVEGLQVISNLDLFDDLGAANATSVIIPVTVSDGVLDIDFAADANNAKLSALVVYSGFV